MTTCNNCTNHIEPEREELDLTVCLACAKAGVNQPEDIRALVDDVELTGGEISIVSAKQYDLLTGTLDAKSVRKARRIIMAEN
jgi:hypothetical protein